MISYIVDSRDKLQVQVPERYKEELAAYRKMARSIRVTITPVLKTRTLEQNAIFHAKINELSQATGIDRDSLKAEIKRFAMSMGYPPEMKEDGEVVVDEGGDLVPLPSSKATVEQMETLIEAVYMWATQNGIDMEEIR